MTISFTICSNNFLAQAKTMVDSLLYHHPEMKAIIFLVDEKDEQVDYTVFNPAEVIVVNEHIVPGYMEMVDRYTILELSTAIRPFLIRYLDKENKTLDRIYYIDPDMMVYDRLDLLDEILKDSNLVITPHFINPIPLDDRKPFEDLALIYGIYNVGFLAINPQTETAQQFLDWWGERTSRFAFADTSRGLFTDQIWFNLVPVFFDKIHILKHPG